MKTEIDKEMLTLSVDRHLLKFVEFVVDEGEFAQVVFQSLWYPRIVQQGRPMRSRPAVLALKQRHVDAVNVHVLGLSKVLISYRGLLLLASRQPSIPRQQATKRRSYHPHFKSRYLSLSLWQALVIVSWFLYEFKLKSHLYPTISTVSVVSSHPLNSIRESLTRKWVSTDEEHH